MVNTILKIGLSSLIGIVSIVAIADDCVPSTAGELSRYLSGDRSLADPCTFYKCLSQKMGCQENDYLIEFGFKYCQKYSQVVYPKFSDDGQRWFSETMQCLQEEANKISIDENQEGLSARKVCRRMKQKAVLTHFDCYQKTGYCTLSPEERKLIFSSTDFKDLIALGSNPKAVFQGIKMLTECKKR